MAKWATGWRSAVILAAATVLLACVAPSAHAAEQVASYVVKAVVSKDGTLAVKATMTFGGPAPADVQQVFDIATRTTDRREYRYTLTGVAASSAGKDLGARITERPGRTIVDIPTGGVTTPIELDYTVHGAAIATASDTTTVSWPLLQGLNLPVAAFDAEVGVPGVPTMVDCAAGDPSAPGACTFYGGATHDNPLPVFHHEDVAAGQVVVATIRFPATVVVTNQDLRDLWSLDRAFSADPLPLGIALGLLVLGGLALWAGHRRVGRDAVAPATPTLVAEFAPVGPGQSEFRVLDAVRPGEVGTLADERVDPIDVTATLLDLAVRGHLQITELPRESAHAPSDWTFARRKGADQLVDYERTLLDAIAPVQGDPVKVSNLAGSVGAVIGQVQSELYDEVVARGWFARRPDSTRNYWWLLGWVGLGVAVLVTVLLAAVTPFGLAGLALVALALALLFLAQDMPARTAKGASVLAGLDVLRGSLVTQPVDTLPTERGYHQLSSILPYAIVLGGKERWLQAVVDSDDDGLPDSTDLDWYHAPDTWHFADLPASLANFVTTVQGTLFSR